MSRITDSTKIEKIKRAIMEIMCEHGYKDISIAMISEKAGVSTGYLYRYYSGKDELIQDIIETNMYEIKDRILINSQANKTVYEYLYNIIDGIFDLVNTDHVTGKFIAKQVLEINHPEWMQDKKDIEINNSIGDILLLGKETGEIDSKYDRNDIEVLFFTLPFRYILLEMTKDEAKKFTKEEVAKLSEMCMKAIK